MAMTDSDNMLAIGGDKPDRITNLPINVIHQIQDHMSNEDAARTSVLCRTWRYIWASNPTLEFYKEFFTERPSSKAIDIISTVLFQHHGPIKTFVVDISEIHSSQHPVVDRWMQFLSRNGLMYLTIENQNDGNTRYKLPSYVYNIMGLEHLVLSNCIFRTPCSFSGFHNLSFLQLTRVSFELDVATSCRLWMPNLEKLIFLQCTGLRFVNIYAPKIDGLCLYGCGINNLRLSHFMNSENMGCCLFLSEEEVSGQDEAMKLTDLFSSWPNLSQLILCRNFVKFLASGTGVKSPPMRLTGLGGLCLLDYDFDSKYEIFALLSILRSCPNLKTLQLYMLDRRKKEADMEVDVNSYFQGAEDGTQRLENLQINRFIGSRAELLFIKFILASAPLLQEAILLVDKSVNRSRSLKISKELMRFPRASPKAEIIYEPWSRERGRLMLRY